MTVSTLAADFIPGFAGHTSGANGRVTRVVLHGTVSACVRGGARNNAAYFQQAGAGGLAHYIVDVDEIIACCDEDVSCWHAPPNHGSIGVELCDWQDADHWGDDEHTAMLTLAARLVRDICDRHQLPLVWLSVPNLLAGDCGVTSHVNVAQAWHKSDHTDPGPFFPVTAFMQLVAGDAPPAPIQVEDDKVLHLIQGDGPAWYLTDFITKRHVLSQDEANVLIFSTIKAGGKIECTDTNGPVSLPQAVVDAITTAA